MDRKPINSLVEKIALECEEAGANEWDILKVIKSLNSDDLNDLIRLRKKVVLVLKDLNPKAAETYASFNRLQVHTSKHEIESFDRGNIVDSLLKETSIPRTLAEKIGSEVEEQIKDLKISYLNTALIRELVDVKLLQYGREDIHWQYTRVGMPLYEVEKQLNKNPFSGNDLLVEYNLFKVIPKNLSDLHFNSDIFISFLEDFSLKPLTSFISPKKSKSFASMYSSLLKDLTFFERFFSIKPSITGLNLFASPFLNKKHNEEKANLIINSLDAFYFGSEQKPVLNLDLFLGEELEEFNSSKGLGFGFVNELIQEFKKSDRNFLLNYRLENEFQVKLLNQKHLNSNLVLLNCSNSNIQGLSEELFIEDFQGVNSLIGLNMPKLVFNSNGNEVVLFEKLDLLIKSIKELIELKNALLERKTFFQENGINLNKFCSFIAIHQLIGSVKEFLSSQYINEEVLSFTSKILNYVSKQVDSNTFLINFTDSRGLKRFNEFNKTELNLSLKFSLRSNHFIDLSKTGVGKYLFSLKTRNKDHLSQLIKKNAKQVEFI